MAGQVEALMDEARSLDLFRVHGAFEVHCSNCHARLNPMGDCSVCGLIGRSDADITRRAHADAAATEKLLREQIAKRRAYQPVKAAKGSAS